MLLCSKEEREVVLTNRENKAPPSHVEREPARCGNHNDSNDEPNDSKAPQDETGEDSNGVEYIACESDFWDAVRDGE